MRLEALAGGAQEDDDFDHDLAALKSEVARVRDLADTIKRKGPRGTEVRL